MIGDPEKLMAVAFTDSVILCRECQSEKDTSFFGSFAMFILSNNILYATKMSLLELEAIARASLKCSSFFGIFILFTMSGRNVASLTIESSETTCSLRS